MTESQDSILCVDDDNDVLELLQFTLGTHHVVHTTTSAIDAIRRLETTKKFAVVIADMNMPEMDGIHFLAKVRTLCPKTTRMLLTGFVELDAAVRAVNQGGIFRFLTKPFEDHELRSSVDDAVEQFQLVTAEQVLLEQTLRGTVIALTNVLGAAVPAALERASRLKTLADKLATATGFPAKHRWAIDVAAMLSQIGAMCLPTDLAEKFYRGADLTARESELVAEMPTLIAETLGPIPRLEKVRAILHLMYESSDGIDSTDWVRKAAEILRVAHDFDVTETRSGDSESPAFSLARMLSRRDDYAAKVLSALAQIHGGSESIEVVSVRPRDLRPGMVIARDVCNHRSQLILARGFVLSTTLTARLRHYPADQLPETVQVLVTA
ncbi:MAG TPA: response regulator [Dehalococcoidia bacterium]|nr:response regulator [Dehalococcoidia bacterium]